MTQKLTENIKNFTIQKSHPKCQVKKSQRNLLKKSFKNFNKIHKFITIPNEFYLL